MRMLLLFNLLLSTLVDDLSAASELACNKTFSLRKEMGSYYESVDLALFAADSAGLRKWTKIAFNIESDKLSETSKHLRQLLGVLKKQVTEDLYRDHLVERLESYLKNEIESKEASLLESLYESQVHSISTLDTPNPYQGKVLSDNTKFKLVENFLYDYNELAQFSFRSFLLKKKFRIAKLPEKLQRQYRARYGFDPKNLIEEIAETRKIKSFPFTMEQDSSPSEARLQLVKNLLKKYHDAGLLKKPVPSLFLIP